MPLMRRWRLFPKYATLIVSLVAGLLILSGGLGAYFSVKETEAQLTELQEQKAVAASIRIEQFVIDIEHQMGWAALPVTFGAGNEAEQRRISLLKLMRQVPAITESAWIDAQGIERTRVSRLAMDSSGTGADQNANPLYLAAKKGKTQFSPVYFLKGTEPYISVVRPALGGGAVFAEVNLKFVWNVVSKIKAGKAGATYVIDGTGNLIAHPDISLVLKKSNLAQLPQVAAALAGQQIANGLDLERLEVISAHAPIDFLGWRVFVDTPRTEALEATTPVIVRALLLLAAGLVISVVASFYLAKALVRPLGVLAEGAKEIGGGNLDRRIDIRTGDELEELAGQFNAMGSHLKESYSVLEQKVEERTAQLKAAQARTQDLLHSILPADVADELSRTGESKPARHESATILFTDFSGFTQAVASIPADRMVAELNELFAAFDDITDRCGVEKIKTIGDAYMAAAGLPKPCADHAQRCVRAALGIAAHIEERNKKSPFKWAIRIGVHSGPVVAGVVGKRKYAFDIWGDTVNLASRLESAGEPGRVNISAYTYDLVQDEFECEYRGKVDAKGKGPIDMYFVKGTLAQALAES
ncbi:MAG: HAMP domain-containing protein [Betaproteobacteria bacterium]|nr:HAMP domain-containing protein [Betaproteobacteria bacterium]